MDEEFRNFVELLNSHFTDGKPAGGFFFLRVFRLLGSAIVGGFTIDCSKQRESPLGWLCSASFWSAELVSCIKVKLLDLFNNVIGFRCNLSPYSLIVA